MPFLNFRVFTIFLGVFVKRMFSCSILTVLNVRPIDIGGIDRRLLCRSLDASRDILKIQDGGRKRAKSSSDLSNIGE